MLKTFYLLLTLLLLSVSSFSQTEVTWKDLKIDSFADVFSEKFQASIKIPIFSNKLKSLEGKEIIIKGYIYSIDPKYKVRFLVNSCTSFSGGPCTSFPGTQPPLQIELKKYKGDFEDEVTVKGTLLLNKDDLLNMNLILEDAEIIK